MNDSFGLFTTNSILSDNSTESDISPTHNHAVLEFPIKPIFYPPLKHCQARDRIWTRVYPDGSVSIHEYKLHDQIGKGAYADVYIAENTILRKTFALRMVDRIRLAKALGTQEAADRFVWSAASLMDKIQHPNVVRLYEVFSNPLAIPTSCIRQEDIKASDHTQTLSAGVIYGNFSGLFSSSQALAIDSFHLRVSTTLTEPRRAVTHDMIRSILNPTHLGQVFDVDGAAVIRPPDDVDFYSNKFIYVIEQCHMKDLHSNFRHLTLRDIIMIFYQIAYGLEHLHSLLIVHHDIKLENMLIDCKGDPASYHRAPKSSQHSHFLQCGIDLSNLYNLCSLSNTSDLDINNTKHLYALMQPSRVAASGLRSLQFPTHHDRNSLSPGKNGLNSKQDANYFQSNSTANSPNLCVDLTDKHRIPSISLGAYDSLKTILDTSLQSSEFVKIAPFYIYYSLIFSNRFDTTERLVFEHAIKRSNINNYSLVAKLSDFDTAKDLSIHGKVLPSLQDLLKKIVHELINVFIDVFTNNLPSLLTSSDFLDDFLEDFFFSTISYDANSYQSSILHTKFYLSYEDLDQLRLKAKTLNSSDESASFLANNSKCGQLQETFTLSTSSSPDLSLTKSTLYTENTERPFGLDQNASDFYMPTPMTHNNTEMRSSSISSAAQLASVPVAERLPLVYSSNDSNPCSPLLATVGRSRSSDTTTHILDAMHQDSSCSTFEKNRLIVPNDIQNNTLTHSSPSYILRCAVTMASATSQLIGFRRYNAKYKPRTRQLPRTYKANNFSGSQRILSRKYSSARRLYLRYFIKYLNELSDSDIHEPRILQDFYFLIELLNKYFTSAIFEKKLAERLTTLFSSSEFICHHPLSKHAFPAYLSSIAGTRHYMPPESLRVWNTPSTATPNLYMGMPSDVWQFGVTLYAVLIGKHRETPLQRSSEEAVQISTHLSLLLADLLCGLLAPSPMQRYTMTEVVNHPFFDSNNFPLSASPDQLFTINFSSKYTPSNDLLKDSIGPGSDTHQENEWLHRAPAGASDPGLISTLFTGVLYPDSLSFASHTFSPQTFVSNNVVDKIQAHIDSKNLRKNIDRALCSLIRSTAHGEELLKMSLRLRKYHFWITIRRRDKLVRENRHILRRSSISNDEIYSLLIQTPHNSKQLLLAAVQYSNSKCSNASFRFATTDEDITPHKYRSGIQHTGSFEHSSGESITSALDDNSLIKSGIKRAATMRLYENACSSTSNLPIYKARPRKFLCDDCRNDWSTRKISSGQFDLMNVAAGDNVLDQLHDEIYLMLNTIPWKSSFVRAVPYIPSYNHSKIESVKRKASFHSIFSANGTTFTEISPFIDIEVNLKELSMGTHVAFYKLFNLFSLGLLDDITTLHDSRTTTVSTRSLEYIFSNSLLKSTGNIWGLVKALKSIQVGFLLECLVSTVPYFEKLTISRLTWIKHLYSTLHMHHSPSGLPLHPTTSVSCATLQFPTNTTPLSGSDPPISPVSSSGRKSPYREASAKFTTSGMSKVFVNQRIHGETVASSLTYTTEMHSYSTEPNSSIGRSNTSSHSYDNSVDFPQPLFSSPSSVPSFVENDSETMRCYYSIVNESDSTLESASPAINSLATIAEEDHQPNNQSALVTVNLSSISQSTYSQSLSTKMFIHPSDLNTSKMDFHTSTGIFSFDDLCYLSRSKTTSEYQLPPSTRSTSNATLPKTSHSFTADPQLDLKEHLQEQLRESIASGCSISEYGNDVLTAFDQIEYHSPRVVRYSSAMIGGIDVPEYKSTSILVPQSSHQPNELLMNNRIMLLHSNTGETEGLSVLHNQIREIWAVQASKVGPSTTHSSNQPSGKGSGNYPSHRTSSQTLRAESQEKSDSARVGSCVQGNTIPLRKHGSTTALVGIFSEMSMQCKAIERMSRFASMQSSSYSSSLDCEAVLSTALPGKEKTSESFRDNELPESGTLGLESASPTELVAIATPNKDEMSSLKTAVKFQRTILHAPLTANNSFTFRNAGASSCSLYDKVNTHMSRSSASLLLNHAEAIINNDSSTSSLSDNNLPSCVLDIFNSTAPQEADLDNVSVAANVTQFLGLDVNNLNDVEIEYSTSTTK
ncbi:Serine/threonine protein kinase [Giardia duodenalis]|uniref:non-specific serine/threonine protein kinase n=1 Tax=Giardia intestinalis TaxID=5741 RepID=V6U2L5_GIAIN|nr:Serine/threonine protein kinase [Giardia intestinalis]